MHPEIAYWDIIKIKETLESCLLEEYPDPEAIDESMTILSNYQMAIDLDDGSAYE